MSKKKHILTEEKKLFILKNFKTLTMKEISKHLDCSITTTQKFFKELNLKKVYPKKRIKISMICNFCGKEFLKNEYEVIERKSGKFCSNKCRSDSTKIKPPSKKEIIKLYKQKKSTNDIADYFNVSKGTIYNWFKKYNIKGRNPSKAQDVFYKTEKGKNAIKKACETKIKRYKTLAFGFGGKFKNHKRSDLNLRPRSMWEANFLRYLKYIDIEYSYEPKVFFFEGIKRGKLAYIPDVYLPKEDLYIEIKGRLWPGDKGKLKNFKKYYPDEFKKLRYVTASEKSDATKYFNKIGIEPFLFYNDIKKKYKNKIEYWDK